MKSTTTPQPQETSDPDALEDRADDLEIEARRLRQQARRLRRAGTADTWLDSAAVEADYGLKMRVVTDAAKRGELSIGRAGRSPRVLRSELDRWLRERARRAPPAAENISDDYAAIVASFGARRAS
jgi:hypothetical protein